MYDATEDPYCYPGTSVLKNVPGFTDTKELAAFEAITTAGHARDTLPKGALDVAHYKAIHRHFFHNIYSWAGEFRTVRMHKGESSFCYPEHIPAQMEELFNELRANNFYEGLSAEAFAAKAAHFLSRLNAIHTFREGNGRTQNLFLHVLAARAGHPLDLSKLKPAPLITAMVQSFGGDESALAK